MRSIVDAVRTVFAMVVVVLFEYIGVSFEFDNRFGCADYLLQNFKFEIGRLNSAVSPLL